jgi:hypothetical protein
VRQDVVELAGEPEGRALREILANASAAASGGTALRIALRSVEVPLDFAPLSLGLDAVVTVRVVTAGTLPALTWESTARGEATSTGATFAQSALTTVTGRGGSSSSVTAGVSALVALRELAEGDPDPRAALVAPLRVRLEVSPGAASGFVVGCWLEWPAPVTDEDLKELETAGVVLRWSASIAWKAIGESA